MLRINKFSKMPWKMKMINKTTKNKILMIMSLEEETRFLMT